MTKLSRKLEGTLPGNVVALSTNQDLAEVLERACAPNRLVVVDYYAPWCRACQKLLRYVQKLARSADFAEVEFATVDFDQADELVTSRAVNQLPTLEIYRGQELKQRWSGANTKRLGEKGQSLKKWIKLIKHDEHSAVLRLVMEHLLVECLKTSSQNSSKR